MTPTYGQAILSPEDIDSLIAWRDKHTPLVQEAPAPLRDIAIHLPHNTLPLLVIRGIRNDESHLRLYLSCSGKTLGYVDFERRDPVFWTATKDTLTYAKNRNGRCLPENLAADLIQGILTIYMSLMALMVYGNEDRIAVNPTTRTPVPHSLEHNAKPRKQSKSNGVTYILRRYKDGDIRTAVKGSHSSPHGIFSVRGHYRHYKSGKVVWIPEYRKGTGKSKNKTYKIGGTPV